MTTERIIRTEKELEDYRAALHARVAEKNPGRDFEVLFGRHEGKGRFVLIWLDGKGELLQ